MRENKKRGSRGKTDESEEGSKLKGWGGPGSKLHEAIPYGSPIANNDI